MIVGIGVDIIEIKRFENVKQSFIDKYFTLAEREYLNNKKLESLAATFAAKESVTKAFGCGFKKIRPIDVEILRNEDGKPYVNLYNDGKVLSETNNVKKIHISISHCKEYATAYVVLED